MNILSVDIGGSKVKCLLSGENEPRAIPSGPGLSAADMVHEVRRAARGWKYDAVSIGYPGMVGDSGPLAEPGNLGPGWVGFDFAAAFDCPVKIVNDAGMQALGTYDGGRMLFLGLGTGVGSALIAGGVLVPLELGELAAKRGTLNERLGRAALDDIGKKKWRKRVLKALGSLQRAFLTDYAVLGGGNAKHLREPLPPGVRLGHNHAAFRGGYRLWGIEDHPTHINGHREAPGRDGNGSREPAARQWRIL